MKLKTKKMLILSAIGIIFSIANASALTSVDIANKDPNACKITRDDACALSLVEVNGEHPQGFEVPLENESGTFSIRGKRGQLIYTYKNAVLSCSQAKSVICSNGSPFGFKQDPNPQPKIMKFALENNPTVKPGQSKCTCKFLNQDEFPVVKESQTK